MAKKEFWFVRKTYGWGWTPATWQGWLVLLVYILFIIWNSWSVDMYTRSVHAVNLSLLPRTLLATAILLVICYLKGETPKWQWGKKTKKDKAR